MAVDKESMEVNAFAETVPIEVAGDENIIGEPALPMDSSFVDQAAMQASFDRIVSREFQTTLRYSSAAVLIIRWAKYLDRNQDCDTEVSELEKLLVNKFTYECSVLILDNKKNPQLQLNRGVANFVFDHDGPCRSNLLIVYYTGHGIHAGELGLDIAGYRTDEGPSSKYEARANWNQAETSLRLAEADVLTILDTCSAGSVMTDLKREPKDQQVFEVLAASGRTVLTDGPGRKSFTRALIDAMEEQLSLYDGGPFATYELQQAVSRRRRKQNAHLWSRYPRRSDRFIKLGRLGDEEKVAGQIGPDCSHLTLRFILDNPSLLSPAQTAKLAELLTQAAVASQVGVWGLEWVRFDEKCQRRIAACSMNPSSPQR